MTKKEKIIQICYADGEINPTFLTDTGRVIKAVITNKTQRVDYFFDIDGKESQQQFDIPVYEYRDITPISELNDN